MKKLIFLMGLLCLSTFLSSQGRVVEVAVSYDKSYSDNFSSTSIAEQRISNIMTNVADIYDNFNVTIDHVTTRNVGLINFPSNQVCSIAGLWVQYCDGRDIVVHFTGNLFTGASGETGGSGMCNSDVLFNSLGEHSCTVSIVKYGSTIFHESRTTAHEIGHQIGMGHELDNSIYCNGFEPYFMCPGGSGGDIDDFDSYSISPSNQTGLDNHMANQDCDDSEDFEGQLNCIDTEWGSIGDTSIDLICGGEGNIPYHFIFYAGSETRTFTASLQLSYSLNFTNSDIDWLELVDPPLDMSSSSNNSKTYEIGDFSIPAFGMFEFDVVVNFDQVDPSINNSMGVTLKLSDMVECPPLIPNCTVFIQRFVRYDLTQTLVGNSAVQDLLDLFGTNYGFDKYYGSDVIIDGTFTVDQDLTFDKEFKFKMKQDATIEVEETLTLEKSSISSCDGDRWNAVIVKNGGHLILDGSLIETSTTPIIVEDGGMVTLMDSKIDDGLEQITIDAGGIFSMMNTEISNSPYGVEDNGAEYISLVDNVFNTTREGYRVTASTNLVKFEGNEFNFNETGVVIQSA